MEKLAVDLVTRARSAPLTAFALLCALSALTAGCQREIDGDALVEAPPLPDLADEEEDAGPLDMRAPPCVTAVASEVLPARAATMGSDKLGTNEGVHVSALFNEFKTNCGDCHVTPASLGQFSLTLSDFLNSTDEFLAGKINKTIQLIRSDNPDKVMPKNGPLLKDRAADHPLRKFADRLEQWLREGRPITFYPKAAGGAGQASAASNFRIAKDVGTKLTNLGNCVPAGRGQALQAGTPEMDSAKALDEKFAGMRAFGDLPKSLRETDLTTFDAAVLMKQRIFSYAPAYTLWADNAKKMRMIRVPVGESVRFDSERQSFDIPDNTRFYKTFLKEVKDLEGHKGYRKIETRLIVARRATEGADGKAVQNAIFGTYRWNEDESEATLVDTPYRDDEGFQDRILQIVIDEKLDDEVLRTKPKDPLAARLAKGSMRSYAIPGFDRCMQCHMGSPGQDFSLGFTPLQIRRRPMGEGGVFEPAARDELNQLERLINYGLITGIRSPDEIAGLEDSQGSRKPRNEHELTAQGYMLGNCAHCHNPNGFPSLKEQVMKEDLNFLPSETGGIFQFPLDRMSRRTFRGAAQDIKVPYITPSLYDFTPYQLREGRQQLVSVGYDDKLAFAPSKWITSPPTKNLDNQDWQWSSRKAQFKEGGVTSPIVLSDLLGGDEVGSARPIPAPWRSLIYRNVDGPFSYQEAGTVYPHMPMHTVGYDCRSRQLLGRWMVSIPARWKSEGMASRFMWPSSKVEGGGGYESLPMAAGKLLDEGLQDAEEQPYAEVMPDDGGYFSALLAADARLASFYGSERFRDCPDDRLDVLDPAVAAAGNGLPAALTVNIKDSDGNVTGERYALAAPARPHYFQTDLRLSKRWVLRRGDWYQSLVEGNDAYAKEPSKKTAFLELRKVLLDLKVDDAFRSFATEKVPFGLWDEANSDKGACEAEFEKRKVPKVSAYAQNDRPNWMTNEPATQPASAGYAPDARIFMTSPGEHVFDLVCSKCHGSKGDGDSALASTMADLTGGLTRVANLRDGIFGPVPTPGSNRAIPRLGFGIITDPAERENWAARYVAWMGLGGTRAYIPDAVVGSLRRFAVLGQLSALQVGTADVLDQADAGNMLKVAKDFCSAVLQGSAFDVTTGRLSKRVEENAPTMAEPGLLWTDGPDEYVSVERSGLIVRNGHAELWERLCSYQNPAPLRVVHYLGKQKNSQDGFVMLGMYRRANYRADAPVGDGRGQIVPSLNADNVLPWCVMRPERDALVRELEGRRLPYCPEDVTFATAIDKSQTALMEQERWLLRGAANAGVAVFLFMDDMNRKISQGQLSPRNVAYNRCQDFVDMK